MIKTTKLIVPFFSLSLLTACVTTGWKATDHYDDFTDTKICRVEHGTKAGRDFTRGFTGIYYTQHFYAENNNGQIRAGIRTEPPLPIGGDIQIKVDDKLFTLTSADAPIDAAPAVPINNSIATKNMGKEYMDNMEMLTKNIQQYSSPYRAYTDKKALSLLRAVADSKDKVKFRTIGINTVTSGTGEFIIEKNNFEKALLECGIKL